MTLFYDIYWLLSTQLPLLSYTFLLFLLWSLHLLVLQIKPFIDYLCPFELIWSLSYQYNYLWKFSRVQAFLSSIAGILRFCFNVVILSQSHFYISTSRASFITMSYLLIKSALKNNYLSKSLSMIYNDIIGFILLCLNVYFWSLIPFHLSSFNFLFCRLAPLQRIIRRITWIHIKGLYNLQSMF